MMLSMMQCMDHCSCRKEQPRFEKRVRGEVEHRGRRATETDGHDHVAQLRQGRVGEDAFDVVLLDGDDGGQQCSEATDARDDVWCERAGDVEQEHVHRVAEGAGKRLLAEEVLAVRQADEFVKALREAGAKEVWMRIASPPLACSRANTAAASVESITAPTSRPPGPLDGRSL